MFLRPFTGLLFTKFGTRCPQILCSGPISSSIYLSNKTSSRHSAGRTIVPNFNRYNYSIGPRKKRYKKVTVVKMDNSDLSMILNKIENSDVVGEDESKKRDPFYDIKKRIKNRFNMRNTTTTPILVTFHRPWSSRLTTIFILCSIFITYLNWDQVRHLIWPKDDEQFITPKHSFSEDFMVFLSDIVGNEDAKSEIGDLIMYLKYPAFFEKFGIQMPRGILFEGPPGTGKTMLAKAMASEAGVPFYSVSGSEFEQEFVGVGASRVRKLFKRARRNSPSIIFIDEIDAVAYKRTTQTTLLTSLNQLLVELDGFDRESNVIVIGATNLVEELDPAILRPGRFDRIIRIGLPSIERRKELLELLLSKRKLANDVNIGDLARMCPGFSGADIRSLVEIATLRTYKSKNEEISWNALSDAILQVSQGIERSLEVDENVRRVTAYHEAGHALVALKMPGANKIGRVTILPVGRALGHVHSLEPEIGSLTTKESLLASIDVCMGGMEAEKLKFGDCTPGSEMDKNMAYNSASMIVNGGMDERYGSYYIDRSNMGTYSKDMINKVETNIRELLSERSRAVHELLMRYSLEHERLAKALLKYETLNLEEVQKVINGEELTSKKLC